jgi:hypothetical protein
MALIDLKSNLKKSNVYKDTPGGGNSGLPYIKQGLPEDSPSGEYLAGIARSSLDTNIRGGAYSTIASTEDTVRISRFLNDFSRGTVFTSKQIGLQKSNPLIETEQRGSTINTRVYSNSNLLAQIALQGTGVHVPRAGFNTNDLLQDRNKYEKIVIQNNNAGQNRLVTLYNSKINTDSNSSNLTLDLDKLGISRDENTLFDYVGGPGSSYGDGNTFIGRAINTNSSLSTPDAGTIDYLNSLGLTDYIKVNKIGGLVGGLYPTSPNLFSKNNNANFDPITIPPFNPSLNPPPSTPLYKSNIPSTPTTNFQKLIITKENIDFEESQFLKTQQPKSRYQQSSPDFIRPEKVPEGMPVPNQFGNTMGYSALLNSKLGELQDFRSSSIDPSGSARSQARDYNNIQVNIATRVGIGNPGARTREQRKYINNVANGNGQDKVNMIPLYTDATNPFENTKYKDQARDLIKFAFEVLDNDDSLSDPKNPNTTKVHFRAFLTNFSDNHSADWNGQRYMGRGENFYTYQGFQREVSFQFKVAAQSKQEMMPLYQKLNYIVSSLYPDYQKGTGFMRGNLHKLTIGEYFYRTPGIITSMNISVDDNYPWEIKYTEPETDNGLNATNQFSDPSNNFNGTPEFQESNSDADMMELPQVLNVQVSFKPILNELPALSKYRTYGTSDTRGILISNDVGKQENFINRINPVKPT